MLRICTVALITATLMSTQAVAQHAHKQHAMMSRSNMPMETGQATFAAIAEIAALLNKDPGTDWTKVDLDALREHLLDMDRVTMAAMAETSVEEDAVTFTVSGTDATIGSIQRMTGAHAVMLAEDTGWQVTTETTDTGAVMRIEPAQADDLARIEGLGFFGVMTVGAHHQMHHLAIAKGSEPHH